MKTIIISLFLFLSLNLLNGEAVAQNVWYVYKNATGANNGTSWNNAWTSLSNIDWDDISAGDSIYVSGGSSDSLVYSTSSYNGISIGNASNNNPSWSFANGDPVIIASAWHSNHNGEVWIATTASDPLFCLRVGNISNLKITGLNFYRGGVGIGNADWGDMDSLVYLENNYFLSTGETGFVFLNGSKFTVANNYMEQHSNNYANDNDPIGISGGRGGHTIHNNIIIMRNSNIGTSAHRDGIQMSNFGFGEDLGGIYAIERLPMTISNNLIIDENPNGTSWNALIYSSGPYCNASFYVYNNIVVSRKFQTSLTGIWIGKGGILPWTNYKNSLYILNNTIMVKGGGVGESADIIAAYNHDTLIVKNNIFVMDTTTDKVLNLDGSDGFPYCQKVFDYNYYGLYNEPVQAFAVDNGLNISWNNWQQAPYFDDVNSTKSTNSSVIFANKYGVEKEDYYTTTGRNAGENLWNEFPFLRTDALGNQRPVSGSWDIGALQFNGNPSNSINLRGKIYLQGPFNSNSMSTTLNQSSLIPNSQPYNSAPWNYNGNESFSSGPTSSMVDWVLVELRSSANPSQVVARRAGVLKNDGLLLEPNGLEGIYFDNVSPGYYYIAVYHRNHLAIMSANPVQLSLNSGLYDFTTAINKAYGQEPMVEVAAGKYAMYAADGNADGTINISDRDDVWYIQNGNMGYLGGDHNMNSGVTIHDVNQYWNNNNGRGTQVP